MCTDGRQCAPDPYSFSYNCTDSCNWSFFKNVGAYTPQEWMLCTLNTHNLIAVVVGATSGIVLLIAIIIIVKLIRKRRQRIDLPNSWFWDLSRLSTYEKTNSDPVTYYKEIKPRSKEQQLLDSLMVKLDFGNIEMVQSYAIVSRVLANSMSNIRKIQQNRKQSMSAPWNSDKDNELRNKTLEFFNSKVNKWEWNINQPNDMSPIFPVVHGTDVNTAWKIAVQGFAALCTLDNGFYGRGIYFSSSARYTIPYFATKRKPAILICLTAPGIPYPVIESHVGEQSLMGKPIRHGFQSHYVVTTKKGTPFSEEEYANDVHKYDELVIDQEAQVVPIFLLIVDPKSIVKLVQKWNRVVPVQQKEENPETKDIDDTLLNINNREVDERTPLHDFL